ncbi:hypothetical protein [Lachnospira multipara]|uniref:hypothetical protein n=1 Tax=Lachnospira multipara TaxID=28051 RepID=UPI0012DEADE4|nr:hypothetical protein [Lachnospira multipara]
MTNIEYIAHIIAFLIIIGSALFGMFMMYAFAIVVNKILHNIVLNQKLKRERNKPEK